jgi:outer membrane protein assembly factor BamA|tara:strand:+ start:513 stop:782 length:270 start_codon:yes stop_codon:yes gene_type:complete
MVSDIKSTYLTASGTVFAGRTRVKAIHYQAGTSPTLVLKNNDASGATQLTLAFHNDTDDNVYLPDEGMLFSDGCFAVLTNVTNVTVFYN